MDSTILLTHHHSSRIISSVVLPQFLCSSSSHTQVTFCIFLLNDSPFSLFQPFLSPRCCSVLGTRMCKSVAVVVNSSNGKPRGSQQKLPPKTTTTMLLQHRHTSDSSDKLRTSSEPANPLMTTRKDHQSQSATETTRTATTNPPTDRPSFRSVFLQI